MVQNPYHTPEYFMKQALDEALKASERDEVPVGAVIAHKGTIISRGHNRVEGLTDTTAHAEILAITSASNYMNTKYLKECEIYITLEPCLMCYGAIKGARLKHIYFGAFDFKTGFTKQLKKIDISYTSGYLESEVLDIMHHFFSTKRK